MSSNIKIIKKSQQVTSRWAGGTTTQLLIFPPDSEYSRRNFKWRLSSARVEDEESTFTHLPGISRIIMVLEGSLILQHEGHHSAELKPFEKDSFSGDWTTRSFGKVTDFNLMMAKDCSGNIEAIEIGEADSMNLVFGDRALGLACSDAWEILYCASGQVSIITEHNESVELAEGELAYIRNASEEENNILGLHNIGDGRLKMVRTTVYIK